jgi:hypothetical protein
MSEQAIVSGFVDDGVGDFLADVSEDDWKARYRDNNGGGNASSFLSFVRSPLVGELVQHILLCSVGLDYADVLVEEKVEDVLKTFFLSPIMCEQERKELRDALLWLGARNQTREMLRFSPFLVDGYSADFAKPMGKREEDAFLRHEELFRKVFFAGLRKRRGEEHQVAWRSCSRPVFPRLVERVSSGMTGVCCCGGAS